MFGWRGPKSVPAQSRPNLDAALLEVNLRRRLVKKELRLLELDVADWAGEDDFPLTAASAGPIVKINGRIML